MHNQILFFQSGVNRGQMITKSILNPDLFKILDEESHEIYHGCKQQWYTTTWQRLAGCGPTVASNLIFYLFHARTPESDQSFSNKKNCLLLMEEIWKYVTPRVKGVSTTKMFYEAVLAYAKAKGLDIQCRFFNLPKNKHRRPKLSEVTKFLAEALGKDSPVAFLNLSNGDETNLDSWHWVTVISLAYTENGDQVLVDILDDGQIKRIDLTLWYNTTTKDGGFVYFTAPASGIQRFEADKPTGCNIE
jgi:hypothetical protein